MQVLWGVALTAILGCGPPSVGGHSPPTLRVNGSTTVNPVVTEIAGELAGEGLIVTVDTQGGSSGGIAAAATGAAELGMSSKPLTDEDRSRYPRADLRAFTIGNDAVALAVHESVWNGGVRALSREQIRLIYEKRFSNWREVDGPDLPIIFFDKEPGRGTWEVFAAWVYPDGDPPTISHPQVGGNEEARTKVGSTPGAVTQLSVSWIAQTPGIEPLGIVTSAGTMLPTEENIVSGLYPMKRPLLLITNGEPSPLQRRLIDYALSSRGQQIVARHGYLPLGESVRVTESNTE